MEYLSTKRIESTSCEGVAFTIRRMTWRRREALEILQVPIRARPFEADERQREAIVLRYYADLSEADIAAAMRISRGAVKSHTARAMASLKAALEQDA